jgi:predicted glutamine amidotransferase
MCRFLVYSGVERYLAESIIRSEHSLIRQSRHAYEMKEPVNGDGFGVGWYSRGDDPTPCVFTGLTPAWSNRNLRRLAVRIRSHRYFAHVRAATGGGWVDEINCHPFRYGRFLWMHNGYLGGFERVKRAMRKGLRDELYTAIKGNTDSEHAFYLFLSQLEFARAEARERLAGRRDEVLAYKRRFLDLLHDVPHPGETEEQLIDSMVEHVGAFAPEALRTAMLRTLAALHRMAVEAGVEEPSRANFAVTDGRTVVVTRYSDRADAEPPSLYRTEGLASGLLITSERLLDLHPDWVEIPPQHLVMVTEDGRIETSAIPPVPASAV